MQRSNNNFFSGAKPPIALRCGNIEAAKPLMKVNVHVVRNGGFCLLSCVQL